MGDEELQPTIRQGETIPDGRSPPSDVAHSAPPGYLPGEVLGQGGMGHVAAATDPELGREVAIKSLLRAGDPRACEQFIFEARVTGQLEHPNIVPVYALGQDADGRPFLSMKRVRGRSLAEVLEQTSRHKFAGPIRLSRLLDVFGKVCDALDFAHSRNVIHRDLKPDNVMVGEFGEVLVMDWGLALMTTAGVEQEPGEVAGTPTYMSPEQARGETDRLDARSDVYSLGAMLYEILALAPPFEDAPLTQLIERVAEGEIVPLRSRPHPQWPIPVELEAIATKAMSHEPGDRYQTVAELKADLSAFAAHLPVGARRDSAWRRTAKWVRRHPTLAMSIGLVTTFLTLGVLIGTVLRTRTLRAERHAAEQRNSRLVAERKTREAERKARDAELLAAARAGDFKRLIEGLGGETRSERDAAVDAFVAAWNTRPATESDDEFILRLGPAKILEYRAAFDRLIELHRKFPGRFEVGAQDYFYRGLLRHIGQGELDGAQADYTKAIELDPDLHTAWNNRGSVHRDAQRWDAAISDFTRAIGLKGEAMHYRNRAIAYSGKGELDRAIADLDIAIGRNAKDPFAFYNRALCWHRKGRTEKAIADYDEAIALKPTFARALNNRGLLRFAKGDIPGAIADYRMSAAADPKLVEPRSNLGVLLLSRGRAAEAIDPLTEALRLRPGHYWTLQRRARAYRAAGRHREARGDLAQLVADDPARWAEWRDLGTVEARLGNRQAAVRAFDQAARRCPAKEREAVEAARKAALGG